MPHDPLSCLEDIVRAARSIETFIEDYDLRSFEADIRTVRAVEREFTIIGEAMNRLRTVSPELLKPET